MCSERRIVRQAFRFELDPNREQRVLLAKSVGASRYVFNWGLAESQRTYELTGKRPRLGELKSRLVGLKQGECPWLYGVSAHIGQSALVDLNNAYENFLKGLKAEGPRSGYPRFKKKGERDSARLYEVELEERHIRLPKIGRVRLKETRSERGFDGRILSATIRRRADRWFVSLAVERERDIILRRKAADDRFVVGVDLGLANVAVIYDGKEARVVLPRRALRKKLAKLRRLDRQLARKQKGSRNREKAKLRRARLHYKRRFDCDACGVSLGRDENAAINLRRYGLRALASELPEGLREVTPVETKALASAVQYEVKPSSGKQEATAGGTRRPTRRSTPKGMLVRA